MSWSNRATEGRRRPSAVWLAPLLGLLLTACAGSRAELRFDDARYPISMSSVVPGIDGTPTAGTKVGEFSGRGKGWSLFWSLIPLGDVDLSESLNEQVEEVGGSAVVNLRVRGGASVFPDKIGTVYLCLLPIWPGGSVIEVEGDIIR